MNAKHTPGPWSICYEGGGAMGIRALLENEDGKCVGYLYEAEYEDEHLIAAAPDLLNMLNMPILALPYVEEGEKFNAPHKRNLSAQIRAAIADATGESE